VIPGIYMTQTQISDLGEGWPRGSPELEAMLMGPVTDTLTVGLISCANESRTGVRFYNQDDNNWTGNVLVADSTSLESIRKKYPAGTPWAKVRFTIHFWEDDYERCQIATDQETFKSYLTNAAGVVVGGAGWLADDFDKENPLSAVVILAFKNLLVMLGGNDDNVGMIVNAGVWNPMHPSDPVSTNHAILRGSSRNGTATLVWRGAPLVPPPPPQSFAVTAVAPGSVSLKATYPLTGSANYTATGWKWESSDNGGATWTVVASTQNTQFTVSAGQNYTIRWLLTAKRVSDGVTASTVTTTRVCTVTGGCGPIPQDGRRKDGARHGPSAFALAQQAPSSPWLELSPIR
jgi:hypothetical protein